MNKKTKTILCLTGICTCIFCLALFHIHTERPQGKSDTTPKQDADGYYRLCTKEDFKWFISAVSHGDIL